MVFDIEEGNPAKCLTSAFLDPDKKHGCGYAVRVDLWITQRQGYPQIHTHLDNAKAALPTYPQPPPPDFSDFLKRKTKRRRPLLSDTSYRILCNFPRQLKLALTVL
jgi:hypothetical protein